MAAEIWDLYDAAGRRTGRTIVRGEEVPAGFYHLCVHIWPVNSRGEFLIQRRSMSVQWKPGLWAVTGGSATTGEDALSAARREMHEELGYDALPDELIRIACLRRTNSFCNVFVIRLDCSPETFTLQQEEVSDVMWCDADMLLRLVSENKMYNYGDIYFRMLLQYQKNRL